jgi:hypothetical protein
MELFSQRAEKEAKAASTYSSRMISCSAGYLAADSLVGRQCGGKKWKNLIHFAPLTHHVRRNKQLVQPAGRGFNFSR